jgi:hypothetical protein
MQRKIAHNTNFKRARKKETTRKNPSQTKFIPKIKREEKVGCGVKY